MKIATIMLVLAVMSNVQATGAVYFVKGDLVKAYVVDFEDVCFITRQEHAEYQQSESGIMKIQFFSDSRYPDYVRLKNVAANNIDPTTFPGRDGTKTTYSQIQRCFFVGAPAPGEKIYRVVI